MRMRMGRLQTLSFRLKEAGGYRLFLSSASASGYKERDQKAERYIQSVLS